MTGKTLKPSCDLHTIPVSQNTLEGTPRGGAQQLFSTFLTDCYRPALHSIVTAACKDEELATAKQVPLVGCPFVLVFYAGIQLVS